MSGTVTELTATPAGEQVVGYGGQIMKRFMGLLAAMVLGSSVTQAQEIVEYVHLDALGSVRAVSNQANAVIERHDYLPFGEECTTGACTANPGVSGGQPRKFTGKERDTETGLDYFGARYYAGRIARFTTIDPVQVPTALVDPQQWNRYAYARDNPLRFLDPTGLYVFDPSASESDKDAFRRGLETAGRAAVSKNLTDLEQDSVGISLDAYGAEGDDNGVTVGFGQLTGGRAATTSGEGLNPNGRYGNIVVTFDLKQAQGTDLAIAIAHEGAHVGHFQFFYTALIADPGSRTGRGKVVGDRYDDITSYISEVTAYRASALTARGLGLSTLSVGGTTILNRRGADMQAIRDFLRTSPLYGLTEANQGPRRSGTQ